MKILTWNINGIRAARKGRPLKEILDSLEADVICLQETKVTRMYIGMNWRDGYFPEFYLFCYAGGLAF